MLLFEENWGKYHFLAVSVPTATAKTFIWRWPGFPPLICIHLHMSTNKKTGSTTAETLIRRWPELKLRWGTQTLPRQYRIHSISCSFWKILTKSDVGAPPSPEGRRQVLRGILDPPLLLLQKDGCQIRPHRFHDSRSPSGRWIH